MFAIEDVSSSSQNSEDEGEDDIGDLGGLGRQRSNSVPGDLVGVKSLLRRGSAAPLPSSSGKLKKQHVQVLLRVRPPNDREVKEGGENCLTVNDDCRQATIHIASDDPKKDVDYNFRYNHVFGPSSDTPTLCNHVLDPILDDVFEGFNASILAYGQTGSGKTHTMMGSPREPGVIPASLMKIFQRISIAPMSKHFSISISMVELYMEKLQDLLDPASTGKKAWGGGTVGGGVTDPSGGIEIRETDALTWIANVTKVEVDNVTGCLDTIQRGMKNRVTAETKSNIVSSRSHAIIVLTVEVKDLGLKIMRRGQLYLVDLAGSEKVSKAETEGMRLNEAKQINLSLFALRQVVTALCENKKRKGVIRHIPYRDSKLTRLLENSLGGNARSVFIITVSPNIYNAEETLSSMRFGERSRMLTTKPKKHKHQTFEELQYVLRKTQDELETQRSTVLMLKSQNSILQQQLSSMASIGSNSRTSSMLNMKRGGITHQQLIDPEISLLLQSQLMCPLSKRTMTDPVVCMDGYTYERMAVRLWLAQRGNVSPTTGASMNASVMIPNQTLRSLTLSCIERELFFKRDDHILVIGDIVEEILNFLDAKSLLRCQRVCVNWRYVARKDEMWVPFITELERSGKSVPHDQEARNRPLYMTYFGVVKGVHLAAMFRGPSGGLVSSKSTVGMYQGGSRKLL
eukprot:PhF_6_TR9206/c1_g1_i1/m.14426/K10396/KIF5; kinesin family member 5